MAHAEAALFGAGGGRASSASWGSRTAASVAGFIAARFALGIGEAGNFPAAIKIVAEWFPKARAGVRHRPLQLRHQHRRAWSHRWWCRRSPTPGAGTGPSSPPARSGFSGWPSGGSRTRRPRRIRGSRAAELAYIRSDPPDPVVTVPWRTLLKYRQTWAFALGKFLTDPVWWLYLFWIPDFLNRNYGINLSNGRPAADRHLPDRRHRQHRRRLALLGADQARLVGQRRPQDGDADLRASRSCRWQSPRRLASCGSRWRSSAWRRRRTRDGPPTSTRSSPTRSRSRRSDR